MTTRFTGVSSEVAATVAQTAPLVPELLLLEELVSPKPELPPLDDAVAWLEREPVSNVLSGSALPHATLATVRPTSPRTIEVRILQWVR